MNRLTDSEIQQSWRERGRAPADERREMQAGLHRTFLDEGKAREIQSALPQGVMAAQEFLQVVTKAIKQTNRTGSNDLSGGGRKALYMDPNQNWLNLEGVRPRRGAISPDILRQMRKDDPVIAAIMQNLKNRAQTYGKPIQKGLGTLLRGVEGFDFRPKGKADHEQLTPAEERQRQTYIDFIMNGGDAARFTSDGSDNREDLERETFSQNLNLIIDQRYTFDSVPIELERDRAGRTLSGIYVLPGDTVHRVDRLSWARMTNRIAEENPNARFVQAINQTIYTTYTSNDLYYDYVNAQDALGMRGYGLSEVEMCARLTIAIMNVLASNTAMFDRNAIPNNIMVLKGMMSESALTEFAESWNGQRLGAGGDYMFPILNFRDPASSAELLPISNQPDDMAFSQFASFTAALDCSIFGVDVSEINISAFGGNNAGLSSGKDTETKLTDSRNRAFLPMMFRLENLFNTILSPLMGDKWEFKFVGLAKMELGMLKEIVEKSVTVNEARMGILGMDKMDDELAGSSLLNNPAVSQLRLSVIKDGVADKNGDLNNNGIPDKDEKPAKVDRAGKKGVTASEMEA